MTVKELKKKLEEYDAGCGHGLVEIVKLGSFYRRKILVLAEEE